VSGHSLAPCRAPRLQVKHVKVWGSDMHRRGVLQRCSKKSYDSDVKASGTVRDPGFRNAARTLAHAGVTHGFYVFYVLPLNDLTIMNTATPANFPPSRQIFFACAICSRRKRPAGSLVKETIVGPFAAQCTQPRGPSTPFRQDGDEHPMYDPWLIPRCQDGVEIYSGQHLRMRSPTN
jgi:hypothetical protein